MARWRTSRKGGPARQKTTPLPTFRVGFSDSAILQIELRDEGAAFTSVGAILQRQSSAGEMPWDALRSGVPRLRATGCRSHEPAKQTRAQGLVAIIKASHQKHHIHSAQVQVACGGTATWALAWASEKRDSRQHNRRGKLQLPIQLYIGACL